MDSCCIMLSRLRLLWIEDNWAHRLHSDVSFVANWPPIIYTLNITRSSQYYYTKRFLSQWRIQHSGLTVLQNIKIKPCKWHCIHDKCNVWWCKPGKFCYHPIAKLSETIGLKFYKIYRCFYVAMHKNVCYSPSVCPSVCLSVTYVWCTVAT